MNDQEILEAIAKACGLQTLRRGIFEGRYQSQPKDELYYRNNDGVRVRFDPQHNLADNARMRDMMQIDVSYYIKRVNATNVCEHYSYAYDSEFEVSEYPTVTATVMAAAWDVAKKIVGPKN